MSQANLAQIPRNGKSKIKPGGRPSLRQVLDMQVISHHAVKRLAEQFDKCKDEELCTRMASGISMLAKGWCSLQDAKREILGKPRAGTRRPEAVPHKTRKPFWEVVGQGQIKPAKAKLIPQVSSEPAQTIPPVVVPESKPEPDSGTPLNPA